jgi:hypothetical protein
MNDRRRRAGTLPASVADSKGRKHIDTNSGPLVVVARDQQRLVDSTSRDTESASPPLEAPIRIKKIEKPQ